MVFSPDKQPQRTESRAGQNIPPDVVLVKQGRYCNADVFFYHDPQGRQYTLKTFQAKSGWVRGTLGRLLIRREARALGDLGRLPGIPAGAQRLDSHALTMRTIEGMPLTELGRRKLPASFFLELEQRIEAMHAAGYVHLDLRNLGNIICGHDGLPYMIDFQSSMKLSSIPRFLRRQARHTDLSGVCKAWRKTGEEPLDEEHAAFMEHFEQSRRFWIFKGYFLRKTGRKIRASALSPFSGDLPDADEQPCDP